MRGCDDASVQGALYLTRSDAETVSFVAAPRSHSAHWPSLAAKARSKRKHWLLLEEVCDDDGDGDSVKRAVMDSAHRIHVPRNAFVAWNSRVFHQNCDALQKSKSKAKQSIKRIASFICMA